MWLRDDGTPYYVGKGKGLRAFRHNSPDREHIIIQDWITEEQAFAAENFLISYYGRIDLGTGCLRNLTDGGEGCLLSPSAVEKRNASIKAAYNEERRSAERTRMLGNKSNTGRIVPKEECQKVSAALLGKPKSAAHCRNISRAKQGSKNPMFGKSNAIAIRAAWTPERKTAQSERMKAHYAQKAGA